MADKTFIKLFDEKQVRYVWDEEEQKYYFSIVDVVQVLTEQPDYQKARKYWNKLKQRLIEEGFEPVTNCHQLKMRAADGKMRLTDVADTKQLLRIIQSIPSKKAEPLKQWLADVGATRIDQMQDPELSIEQAVRDYRRLGYSDAWINQRIRSIEVRKELTDEWRRGGMEEGVQFASLTDILTKAWSGRTTREYKSLKGLRKESLRDNMTNVELALNTLAEASATELSKQRSPQGFNENAQVAHEGGNVAKVARQQLEQSLGRSVVTAQKASDYIRPIEQADAKELPFSDDAGE
ncbi:MAG: Bro-N domain-containing protein [Prevotella sp.]|nr:Bro-N domain-containing protein [Prevotella sp.]MBR3480033.1 Bro-N domain-containing protein [Prevotella sp.]MBR6188258.1 Bro-N domain-containing protein [Prevotella sp.]